MYLIIRSVLRAFLHGARLTIAMVTLITLFGALASVVAPYLFSRAIDELQLSSSYSAVITSLLLYAALFGCAKAFSQSARFLVFLCSEHLNFTFNTLFFSRLLRKSPAFFMEHNAAEIGSVWQRSTQTLSIITRLTLGSILPGCVQIAGSVIVLGHLIDWPVALIVLLYGGVVITIDYLRTGHVRASLNAAIEHSQANAKLTGNAVATIETVRFTGGEDWIVDRFSSNEHKTFANWRKYSIISIAFSLLIGITAAFQLGVTFVILVPRYDAGLISIGSIVLFNTMLIQLNEPFHMIGTTMKEFVEAAAHFKPIAVMWTADGEEDPDHSVFYKPSKGILAFNSVAFRYPNGRGLQATTFIAQPGAPTFIVGETGSGKSTALRLLLKGLQPVEGSIIVDGVDLSDISGQNWFSHVGVVPQDVVLLNDSLCTNIVFGRPYDFQRLRAAAEHAAILSRIDAMPDGFDTIVGERGFKLSGGERQRIAIARALYNEPTFLILDEASSALDEYTEKQIMDNLREIDNQLTIIAVTHRTSIFNAGDQVVRLSSSL